MSKFDTIRASGEMMPTAMGGSTAMDGKPSSFCPFKTRNYYSWPFRTTLKTRGYCIVEILFQTNLGTKVGLS